ncbi:MAG: hypothetical protein ACI8R9_001729 [Paraglaciecola sp.]|jgi:hypothetical protein
MVAEMKIRLIGPLGQRVVNLINIEDEKTLSSLKFILHSFDFKVFTLALYT